MINKKRFILSLLLLVFAVFNICYSQEYVGIYSSGNGRNLVTEPMELTDFYEKASDLVRNQNYKLDDVEYVGGGTPIYDTRGFLDDEEELQGVFLDDEEELQEGLDERNIIGFTEPRFIGVFSYRRDGEGNQIEALSPDEFYEDWHRRTRNGRWRLVDIEVFNYRGERRFMGVYSSSSGGRNFVTKAKPWNEFLSQAEDLVVNKGYRLIDVEIFEEEGSGVKFIGVFQSGTGSNFIKTYSSWGDFHNDWEERHQNRRQYLRDLEVYLTESEEYVYIATYGIGQGEHLVTEPQNWATFHSDSEELIYNDQDLRLIDIAVVPEKSPPPPPPLPCDEVMSLQAYQELIGLPEYVELTDNNYIMLDFMNRSGGWPFTLIIPRELLEDHLPVVGCDGEFKPVFPDKFCGIVVKLAGGFTWYNSDNEVVEDAIIRSIPYPALYDLDLLESDEPWIYETDLEFHLPINSKCGYDFKSPLTYSSISGNVSYVQNLLRDKYLIIDLQPGRSKIEFVPQDPVPPKFSQKVSYYSDKRVFKLLEVIGKHAAMLEKGLNRSYVQELATSCLEGYCPVRQDQLREYLEMYGLD